MKRGRAPLAPPLAATAAMALAAFCFARWLTDACAADASAVPPAAAAAAEPGPGAAPNAPSTPSTATAAREATLAVEVLAAETARVEVMRQVAPSVVAVFSATGDGGGSGVVISPDGYALTNFHVAGACGAAMKCGLPDGRIYDAVLVGLDPTGDVALIKLLGRDDFPAATLGDSDELRVGDNVFAMGNPFLLATDFRPTATYGIVSGVRRYQPPAGTILEYTDCIQIDASINPGNSGGPLFDMRGRLVGINGRGSFEKRGRVNVGLAYAISINQIKNFLGQLRAGRIVDHASLGAVVALNDRGKVVVSDILDDSEVFRRGLRAGDELVSFAGRSVATPNAFKNVLGIYPEGWRVPLSYRRGTKPYEIFVKLPSLHGKEELIETAEGTPQPAPMPIPKKPEKPPKPGKQGGAEKPSATQPARDPPADKNLPSGKDVPGNASRREGAGPPDGPTPDGEPPEKAEDAPSSDGLGLQPPLPEAVKKVYEKRHGFANYYFNRLERDRVWSSWLKQSDLSPYDGAWTATGRRRGGGPFALRWAEDALVLQLPSGETTWRATNPLPESEQGRQADGMLRALHDWRRLNRLGVAGYGEVDCLGLAPPPRATGESTPPLAEVLVGRHASSECQFYFAVDSGRMTACELSLGANADACEVHLRDYRVFEGHLLPGVVEVRYAGEPFAVFEVQEWHLARAATGDNATVPASSP